jgi:hypothetical protein
LCLCYLTPISFNSNRNTRERYFEILKVIVLFALEQAMKAQMGVDGYFYSFLNLGVTGGRVVNATL